MAKPKPTVSTEIIPYIFYRDVPAALIADNGGRGFCDLGHQDSPEGFAVNREYSTLAVARPHRI